MDLIGGSILVVMITIKLDTQVTIGVNEQKPFEVAKSMMAFAIAAMGVMNGQKINLCSRPWKIKIKKNYTSSKLLAKTHVTHDIST